MSITFWLFVYYNPPKLGQARFWDYILRISHLCWPFLVSSAAAEAQRLQRKWFVNLEQTAWIPAVPGKAALLFIHIATCPLEHELTHWTGFHTLIICVKTRQFMLPHSPGKFHRDETSGDSTFNVSPCSLHTTALNSSRPQALLKWLWRLFSIL